MTPFYEHGGITIYHGDCLEVVPGLSQVADSLVTDPPYKLSQEYGTSVDSDNLLAVAAIWPLAPMLRRAVRPGGIGVVFYDTRILPLALRAFRDGGWKYLRALTPVAIG